MSSVRHAGMMMTGVELLKVYRVSEWASTKIPILWIVFWATVRGEGSLSLWVSYTAFCCALLAFGYAINDLSDEDADRKAGKRRIIHAASPLGRWTIALAPLALGFVAAAAYGVAAMVAATSAFALAVAYSFKPFRLKEHPVLGPFAASLAQWVMPALPLLFVYPPNSVTFVALALGVTTGLRAILVHQLLDATADLRSGVQTTATVYGRRAARAWLYEGFLPLEAALTLVLPLLLIAGALGDSVARWAAVYVAVVAVVTVSYLLFHGWRPREIAFRVEFGPSLGWSLQYLLVPTLAVGASRAAYAIPIAGLQLLWMIPQVIVWIDNSRRASNPPLADRTHIDRPIVPRPVASRGYTEVWMVRGRFGEHLLALDLKQTGNFERSESCRVGCRFILQDGSRLSRVELRDYADWLHPSLDDRSFAFRGAKVSVECTQDAQQLVLALSSQHDGHPIRIRVVFDAEGEECFSDAQHFATSAMREVVNPVGRGALWIDDRKVPGEAVMERLWFAEAPERILRRWTRFATIQEGRVYSRFSAIRSGFASLPGWFGQRKAVFATAGRRLEAVGVVAESDECDWWWVRRIPRPLGRQHSRTTISIPPAVGGASANSLDFVVVDEVWL
jgi:4-hydroxybenzoate polyprenyltransferase